MALKDWALPDVAKMELIHPVTGATGLYLSILPEDSEVYRKKVAELARRRVKAGSELDVVSENELNLELAAELTAASVVGWSNDEAFDGPYSPERAIELMKLDGLAWVREQVAAFRSKRTNFFRTAG
jgi:hypothetical protein